MYIKKCFLLGGGQALNKACISKLILPGSLVSVSICTEHTWFSNIVYQCCDNESIDIPLTRDLMKSCIFVDKGITIKYKNEYFEYIIQGLISKIELCGSPFIRIQVLNVSENKNQRIFPRHDIYLPANLSVNNNTYFCTISNISLSGIAFLVDKEMPSDIECEANIFLNENNTIFCKGMILRCSPQNSFLEFSMQFTFMDEENSNCLYSYLYSIDNSYDYLRSKYLINS